MSRPDRHTRPELTRSSPAAQCSSVDLPDPEGPMITVGVPARQLSEVWRSASYTAVLAAKGAADVLKRHRAVRGRDRGDGFSGGHALTPSWIRGNLDGARSRLEESHVYRAVPALTEQVLFDRGQSPESGLSMASVVGQLESITIATRSCFVG